MIVPILQSKSPLEDNLIQRKDLAAYGPGVPEYQETIQIRPRAAGGSTHPWKVTSAGAASVAVGAGKILGIRGSGGVTLGPFYNTTVSFIEEEIAISGAGWVYAVVATSEALVFTDDIPALAALLQSYNRTPTAVSITFSTSSPAAVTGGSVGEIWIPIAQVDIDGGQAVVLDQILTYNPIISLGYTTTTA